MYNIDTELLFPSRVIEQLRDLRGQAWRDLVDQVVIAEQTTVAHLAFVLMMVRLDGCTTCQSDSYRALRGCTQCASLAVSRFRGSDEQLVDLYRTAHEEVETFLNNDPA